MNAHPHLDRLAQLLRENARLLEENQRLSKEVAHLAQEMLRLAGNPPSEPKASEK